MTCSHQRMTVQSILHALLFLTPHLHPYRASSSPGHCLSRQLLHWRGLRQLSTSANVYRKVSSLLISPLENAVLKKYQQNKQNDQGVCVFDFQLHLWLVDRVLGVWHKTAKPKLRATACAHAREHTHTHTHVHLRHSHTHLSLCLWRHI